MSRAPALPRSLARRLDRLARRAHAFHRFAHHPLCDNYAGELIALGRRQRLCRGCTLALLGALAGFGLGATCPAGNGLLSVLCALAVLPVLTSLALHSPREPRPNKAWTRALPAAGAGALLALSARSTSWQGAAPGLLTLAVLAAIFVYYRRRGPDRSACQSCPERTQPAPCSGFREIMRAERAFQRRARQLLDQQIAVPNPIHASSENGVKLVSRS